MCGNDAIHIFEIIEYITFFYICIIDIRKKIIPDRGFIILVIIGLLKGMINTNIEGYFLGMCVYPMPLIILYILEDYFKKELIGFGDIKLMMGIGGNMGYKSLAEVLHLAAGAVRWRTAAAQPGPGPAATQIGRASCRERV